MGYELKPAEICNEITKVITVSSRLLDDLYEFGNVGLLPGEDLVSPRWANADGGGEKPIGGSARLALTLLLLTWGVAAASLSSQYHLSDGSVATPTASLHLQKRGRLNVFVVS